MSGDFSLSSSELSRAIDFVRTTTTKDVADIINRAGLVVVIGGRGVKGAIQRTPRADAGKIAGVSDSQLAAAVATKLRKKGVKLGRGNGKSGRNSKGQFVKGGGVSSAQFKNMVKRERARRLKSRGYTAGPGWSKAAQAFGGKGVRGVQSGFGNSEAAKGSGSKATPSRAVGIIENTAPAAEKTGEVPLQEAMKDTARDMVEHGTRRLQRTFDKVSAK